MKKGMKTAATVAILAIAEEVAWASNPFSDVSTSDWSYRAVSSLSEQGIVEGYPDGTFRGKTNITRYEFAKVIARLMAKEDQYTPEQRATIDKLAGEYVSELDSLGVRVSNIGKKVGYISWSGDARLQFQNHGAVVYKKGYKQKFNDSYTGRIRFNVSGQVNDKVRLESRFVTEMGFDENSRDNTPLGGRYLIGSDGNSYVDRIHLIWNPHENIVIDVGRTGVGLSKTEIFMDPDSRFDGIVATYDDGALNASLGYGRFRDVRSGWHRVKTVFAKAGTRISDVVDLSAFYLKYAKEKLWGTEDMAIYGIGAAIKFGSNFALDGDYIKHNDHYTDNASMWTAGVKYNVADMNCPGSYSVSVHYVDADRYAYEGGYTAWDMTDMLDYHLWGWSDARFWVSKIQFIIDKNMGVDAYYYFNFHSNDVSSRSYDDTFGTNLNYKF